MLLLLVACDAASVKDPVPDAAETTPAWAGCDADVVTDRDGDGVPDETLAVTYAANGDIGSFVLQGLQGEVTFDSTWEGGCLTGYTNVVTMDGMQTVETLTATCDDHDNWTEETRTTAVDAGEQVQFVVHALTYDGDLLVGDDYGLYASVDDDPTATGSRAWDHGDDDLVDRYEQAEDPGVFSDLVYVYAYDGAGRLSRMDRTFSDRSDVYVEDWDDAGRLLSYGVSEGEFTWSTTRGYDGDAALWSTEDEDRDVDGSVDVAATWTWACP